MDALEQMKEQVSVRTLITLWTMAERAKTVAPCNCEEVRARGWGAKCWTCADAEALEELQRILIKRKETA